MSKIIAIDSSAIAFNAIHSYGNQIKLKAEGKLSGNFILPTSYTYFNMILSALKRIGVDKEDNIFICLDGFNSWRKAFLSTYKGQRKALRDSYIHIDWNKCFNEIANINSQLEVSTNWYFLHFNNQYNLLDILHTEEGIKLIGENYQDTQFEKDYGLEADDILATISKQYIDKEVIIVTCDKDMYQLAHRPNTKIYSLNIKVGGQKGGYVLVEQPLKILATKIRKGDISDNIIVTSEDTPKDEEIRAFIVNLLELPSWVELPIISTLNSLISKEINSDKLPFPKSLALRYYDIYKKDKVISQEYCTSLLAKREVRKKKKQSEKRKQKKELDNANKV
jgi:hypothetical protein